MTIWIYTGGRPSNSAKALAELPGFKRLRLHGNGVKANDTVVNWGTTKVCPAYHDKARTINGIQAIKQAANKSYTFNTLAGEDVSTVPWTQNKAVAQEWRDAGHTVVARKVLTGHSGDGIIIVGKEDDEVKELPDVPLYTQYIFKTKEFRVHATRSTVIDTQQKVRDPAVEPKTWKVRSHANGFIFQRNNIEQNVHRDALAIQAIIALGLDFGAVDIIQDKKGKFYVLEVNTGPGLEGQTVTNYAECLKELAGGKPAAIVGGAVPVHVEAPAAGAGIAKPAVAPAPEPVIEYIHDEHVPDVKPVIKPPVAPVAAVAPKPIKLDNAKQFKAGYDAGYAAALAFVNGD